MAFFRGPGSLVKSFIISLGVAGVSAGVWYMSTRNSSKSIESKTDEPESQDSTKELEIKNLKVEDNFFPLTGSVCFGRIFSGAFFGTGTINKTEADISWSESGMPEISTDSVNAEGCFSTKYSEKSSKEQKNWMFESEIAIKSDKVGVAVWLDVNSKTEDNQRYQVYLLQKGENNEWSVKFGVISIEATGLKEIKELNGSDQLSYSSQKWDSQVASSGAFENPRSWKTSSPDAEGSSNLLDYVLNDLKKEQFMAKYVYKGDDKKWYEYTSSKDVKATLEKWFKPFEKVKGKWE